MLKEIFNLTGQFIWTLSNLLYMVSKKQFSSISVHLPETNIWFYFEYNAWQWSDSCHTITIKYLHQNLKLN